MLVTPLVLPFMRKGQEFIDRLTVLVQASISDLVGSDLSDVANMHELFFGSFHYLLEYQVVEEIMRCRWTQQRNAQSGQHLVGRQLVGFLDVFP